MIFKNELLYIEHKGPFHFLFQDTLLAACTITVKMFFNPVHYRGLGSCCCEVGTEVPWAVGDRSNEVGAGVPSCPHGERAFHRPVSHSPGCLPTGEAAGSRAPRVQGCAGTGASGQSAGLSSAHTGTSLGSMLLETHMMQGCKIKFATVWENVHALIPA